MFKVNNKDTKATPLAFLGISGRKFCRNVCTYFWKILTESNRSNVEKDLFIALGSYCFKVVNKI